MKPVSSSNQETTEPSANGGPILSLSAPSALDVLLQSYVDALGADAALLVTWDAVGADVVAGINLDDFGSPDLDQVKTFTGGGKPAVFGPALAWARASGEAEGKPHITYICGAPMRVPGGGRGALLAGFVHRPAIPEDLLLSLSHSYAGASGLCLHEGGGLGGLLAAASHDVLTGCLNYRGLIDTLTREISRCERHGGQLSCCFLDLDGFGEVNVRDGHMRGNEVLSSFGAAVREGLRGSDSVGRFGGDEFIVVMPGTGSAEALAIVRRLSSAAAAATKEAADYPVQVSAGLASWSEGMSIRDLLDQADESLLRAKAAGGGFVVDASAPRPVRLAGEEDPAPA